MNEENTKKSPEEMLEDAEAIRKKRPRGSRSTSTGRSNTKPKASKPTTPKVEQPTAQQDGTALKVIAERLLEQQRAQREAEREAEAAAWAEAEDVAPQQEEPQTPTMELGASDMETHTLNGPFAPQIRPKKQQPNDDEEATPAGSAPKRRKPKKVEMALPETDPNAPRIQQMQLGEQVTLDPNGTTYSHAENTPIGAGELSLHNTKKDAEEKNLASVMNMVNEMEAKIQDLTGKLDNLTDEIVKRDVRITDLETQLFQARTSIDTMYKPACQIVLNKKRYRKKLEKDLLDKLVGEAK